MKKSKLFLLLILLNWTGFLFPLKAQYYLENIDARQVFGQKTWINKDREKMDVASNYQLAVTIRKSRNQQHLILIFESKTSQTNISGLRGGLFLMVPSTLKPNIQNVKIGFYDKRGQKIESDQYPYLEDIMLEILKLLPGTKDVYPLSEKIFKALNTGQLKDIIPTGVFANSSGNHVGIGKTWQSQYYHSLLIKAHSLRIFIPVNGSVEFMQKEINNKGLGVFYGLRPSVVPARVGILFDNIRLGSKPSNSDFTDNFSSTGIFTDSRDGKSYKWIKIGQQIWMAENINYRTSNGSWCYDNIESECEKYGRLYDWETANKVCPQGWKLPSDTDWTFLTDFLGNGPGNKLKSTAGWSRNGNGDNSSGFNALPGGYRKSNGGFGHLGDSAGFWSSSPRGLSAAWNRGLGYYYDLVSRDGAGRSSFGFSVRCIKN
ncbi:fibrobacter succinogenes major paralogous domain-containing protein [Bacteroidota bacterium]